MGPLDWSGPAFLGLYVVTLVAASLITWIATHLLARTAGATIAATRPRSLTPARVGFLQKGPARAVQAALVALRLDDRVKLTPTGSVTAIAPADAANDVVERAILLATEGQSVPTSSLIRKCAPAMPRVEEYLMNEGLLLLPGQRWTMRLVSGLVFGAVGLMGVVKVMVGLSRGKPVLFLVALLAITLVIEFLFVRFTPRRTIAGDDALRDCRLEQRRMQRSVTAVSTPTAANASSYGPTSALAPDGGELNVAYLCALYGPQSLANTDMAADQRFVIAVEPIPTNSSSGGHGGSSHSGSGCGSSCSGGGSSCGSSCGGGGGGGCGGCGGS